MGDADDIGVYCKMFPMAVWNGFFCGINFHLVRYRFCLFATNTSWLLHGPLSPPKSFRRWEVSEMDSKEFQVRGRQMVDFIIQYLEVGIVVGIMVIILIIIIITIRVKMADLFKIFRTLKVGVWPRQSSQAISPSSSQPPLPIILSPGR